MNCTFSPIEGGWRCEVCGRTVRMAIEKPPIAACRDGQAGEAPSLLQKAANFAAAAAAHVAAGMPRATQEQIDARHAICQTCEHYNGRACRKCGCPVNREKAFISKLSWANEKCPVGKWGPVD